MPTFRSKLSSAKLVSVVALCTALGGGSFAIAATVSKRAGTRHGRDLVVDVNIEDLGAPPHILVGASGTAPRFLVDVRTRNKGDVAAGPSKTALIIKSGPRTRVYQWNVGALRSHGQADHKILVENLEPDLGFTKVKAMADYHNAVRETNKRNNEQTQEIAVEPREWDVSPWTTEDTGSGVDNLTKTGDGFYLRFQKYDHGFAYQAYGPVTDTPKTYPGCAPVSGSKTVTQTPWAGSLLKIDPDLRTYDAFVPTSSNNFFATCTIGSSSFQIQVAFVDLSTGKAVSKKDPDDRVLEGVDSMSLPGGGTESWTWTFTAHLPKP